MPDLIQAAKALSRAAIAAAKAQGAGGSYLTTRFQFSNELGAIVADYLNGANARAMRNEAKRLMVERVADAAQRGFRDGSGDPLQALTGDDLQSLVSKQNEQLAFVDGLFDDLLDVRRQDPIVFPNARLAQYTNSLDDIYNLFKLRGAANPTLVFSGSDGAASCATCARLQGRQMPAQWWMDNGLIPGAANMNYRCKGFNCQHALFKLDGTRFTI